ncbi:hypothetical protein AB3R30_18800 [Leptolyngbyaceae cyanobacterium UHCC 1019]
MTEQMQITVPEWAKGQALSYPFWDGAPRSYSFDGSTGKFSLGSEEKGSEIYVQVFDWRWKSGERWKRLSQMWLDVACVDTDGCVAQMSLKKDSAVNLHVYLNRLQSGQLMGTPILPEGVWLKLEAQEQVVKVQANPYEVEFVLETYYVIRASFSDFASEEQVKGVAGFLEARIFDWVLVGEV